jgi:hypothetical protein
VVSLILDIDSLRLDPSLVGEVKPPPKRPQYKGRFLKGPIPVAWLAKALSIRGSSAIGVGLALWHLSAMKHNEKTVHLSMSSLRGGEYLGSRSGASWLRWKLLTWSLSSARERPAR